MPRRDIEGETDFIIPKRCQQCFVRAYVLVALTTGIRIEKGPSAGIHGVYFDAALRKRSGRMPKNNCVRFDNWYAQPIHCPFCGHALEPIEEVSCKHLLYVAAAGNFLYRSQRFDEKLGEMFGVSEGRPDFDLNDKKNIGAPYDLAKKVRAEFPPSIEFEIVGPTDSSFVGYAALDDELCVFGRDHQSPYDL